MTTPENKSNSPMRVLAVVVTRNRLELLKRCLAHLAAQTRLPDAVLVIDHESTDGTKDYLVGNRINHITQANGGSSAGWARGIDEAHSGAFEYTWLMDDDGYPDRRALGVLVENIGGAACLSAVVVKEDSPDDLVFAMPLLNARGFPVIFSPARKIYGLRELRSRWAGSRYPYVHLFNGALIRTALAKAAGNVDRKFFMYGDELDFMWRLKGVGAVNTDLNALHYHPDVGARALAEFRVYFFVRNSILVYCRYLDARWLRCLLVIGVTYFRIGRRNGFLNMMSYLIGRNAKFVFYGILDSLTGRMENRFVNG